MISASIRTPVEIWTRILKYAIDVPIFLDADPIESHGIAAIQQYHWDLPYWSSERHRNAFRRVCSSWNQYLSKFSHRYIRLTDIVHGLVPKIAFPHAIRLNLDLCECEICTGVHPTSSEWDLEDAIRSHYELLRDLVNTHGPPSGLKIIHGDGFKPNEISWMFGKLHSIVASNIGFLAETERAHLRVFIGDRNEDCYTAGNSAPPLQFPALTTLSIWVENFAAFTGLRLGALKHLSVACETAISSELNSPIEMLTTFGSQLETFFWTDKLSNHTIPGEIWSICPKLLRIQTPYKWEHEPPLSHPIRCVRLSFPRIRYRDRSNGINQKKFRERLPVSIDGRFEERGVMLAYHWSQLLFPLDRYWSIHGLWEAVDVAADSGIEFVDLDSLYLEEYILTFLVNVWRRVMVRRTYRHEEVYNIPVEF